MVVSLFIAVSSTSAALALFVCLLVGAEAPNWTSPERAIVDNTKSAARTGWRPAVDGLGAPRSATTEVKTSMIPLPESQKPIR